MESTSQLRVLLVLPSLTEQSKKKIVKVSSGITVRALTELAASSFGLDPNSTMVETYDTDFEEWVSLPDDFVPIERQRLLVTSTVREFETVQASTEHRDPGPEHPNHASEDSTQSDEDETQTDSSNSSAAMPDSNSSAAMPDSEVKDDLKPTTPSSAVIVIKGEEDTDIPDPFPFPLHYRSDIEAGLALKSMPPLVMTKFLTRIANVMVLYKRTPTDKDYEKVANEIIARYPFMRSPIEGTGHIIKALRNRFREFRRKKNSPSGVKVELTTEKPKNKKRKLEYDQNVPSSEDQSSFERHNRYLREESEKRSPNMANVKHLMSITFAQRKKDLVGRPIHVLNILDKYPFLKHKDILISEMWRYIRKEKNPPSSTEVWKGLFAKIFDFAKGSSSKSVQSLCSDIEKREMDQWPADVLSIKLLMILGHLTPDHKSKSSVPELLLTYIPASQNIQEAARCSKCPHPFLLVKEKTDQDLEVHLVVEKTPMTMMTGMEAPAVLLAAYFTFDMKYPKGLFSFFTLLEIVLLGLRPKKIPTVVSNILVAIQ